MRLSEAIASQGLPSIDLSSADIGADGLPKVGLPQVNPSVATGDLQPPDGLLGRVANQESGGRDYASDGSLLTSPAGAEGRMQVMPDTQNDPGFGVQPAADHSPDEIARVGKDYLAAMQDRYGNTALALAAYNAGPGAVDSWIQQNGDPRTGEVSEWDFINKIPYKETKDYVTAIVNEPHDMPPVIPGAASTKIDIPGGTKKTMRLSEALAQPPETPPTEKSMLDVFNERLGAGIQGAAQGASANFGDEALAGLSAAGAYGLDKLGVDKLIGGKEIDKSLGDYYDSSLTKNRADIAQSAQDYPAEFIAGNLAGAIGTGIAGAGTKAGLALTNGLRNGSIFGRNIGLVGRAVKSAGAGAAASGVYGVGRGEGLDRLSTGIEDAGIGAGVGAVLPVAGAAVRALVGKPIEKLADTATRQIGRYTGEIPERAGLSKPMKKVYDRLRADYPDDLKFAAKLNSYFSKRDQSLLEAGGNRTANLAEGSAMYPSGGAKAAEFFGSKVDQAPQKLKGSLAKTVSKDTNYADAVDEVVATGRTKAAPVYAKAFQANQSVDSPVINRILRTPEGKSALAEAVKNMQNEMSYVAKPDPELTALVKELSDIGAAETTGSGAAKGLKLKTLDYVKRAMDSTYRKAMRTGDEGEAQRILNLKKGLVTELDKADKSGLYAKARRVSGDYLSARDAMEAGRNFFKEDSEIVERLYKGFGKSDRDAYRIGVIKQARDIIDNTVDGTNVARMFNKESVRNKLKSILKPDEYDKLLEDAQSVDKVYKLRNQMTGNSRSIMRQIATEEFDDAGQEIIHDLATKGMTRTAFDNGVKLIARQFKGMNDNLASEVADILYETDPKKKFQIVKQLVQEMRNGKDSIRKTNAAKKLQAFYGISDLIAKAKSPLAPLVAGEAVNHSK